MLLRFMLKVADVFYGLNNRLGAETTGEEEQTQDCIGGQDSVTTRTYTTGGHRHPQSSHQNICCVMKQL